MNFKNLSRRDFMQMLSAITAGATLGPSLPIFRSLAATGGAPTRLLLVAKQHGWLSDPKFGDEFFQANPNAPLGCDLPPSHTDLLDIAEHVTIINGVRGGYWGNAHDVSYSDIFTSSVPALESSSTINSHFPRPTGPSLDWYLGQRLDKKVLRVSPDYSSWGEPYHPLSFDGNQQSLSFITNLNDLYDAVASPILNAQNPNGANALEQIISQELFKLSGNSSDRIAQLLQGKQKQKMTNFKRSLSNINPNIVDGGINTDVTIPQRPSSGSDKLDTYKKTLDLIKLAFRADTHRISVLGINGSLNDFAWTDSNNQSQNGNIWSDGFHHAIAHYNGHAPDSQLALDANNKLNMKMIVDFAKELDSITDVDGRTMLENTIIVLNGEVGNGQHDRRRKPIIVIGGRGSAGLNTGRFIQTGRVAVRNRNGFFLGRELVTGETHTWGVNYGADVADKTEADLLVGLARAMGQNINTFGLPLTNTEPIILT